MFLVDTNVWSELRKRDRMDPFVRAWALGVAPETLFLSVISIFELELGVVRLERRDPMQGARLRAWLEGQIIEPFGTQALPVTTAIARRSAALHVPDPKPERDALIAATAMVHDFTLVTRNTTDFVELGTRLLNPWQSREG
jgi:toxin FitB